MSLRNSLSPGKSLFFLVSRYPPLGSSASPLGSCRHHGIPYLKPGLGHDAFMCFGHSAGQSSLRLFITAACKVVVGPQPYVFGGWAPTTGTSGVLCGLQRNQFTGGTYSDSRPPRVLQGFWVAPTGRCRTTTAIHQDHQSCWPILKTGSLVPFDHFSSIAWKDVESLEFYIFGGPHWLTNLDGNSIQLTGLHWDAHQVNPCWDWAIERTRIG